MNQGNNNNNNKRNGINPLELLRDVRNETVEPMSREALQQIFGKTEKNFSGEIMPGEAIEMKEVYSGKTQEKENNKKRVYLERKLRQEDRMFVEKRTNELRLQIDAIHEEIVKIAKITPQLTQEVQMAAIQAPSDPSTYELYFLERIFEFIRNFRKRIEDANVWLHTSNKRASKKNVWGQNYKKSGAKYLLSGEHYLSRSAA